MRSLVICKYRDSNMFWEPFPHLKCENGPGCGNGMDCPVIIKYISKRNTLNILNEFNVTVM